MQFNWRHRLCCYALISCSISLNWTNIKECNTFRTSSCELISQFWMLINFRKKIDILYLNSLPINTLFILMLKRILFFFSFLYIGWFLKLFKVYWNCRLKWTIVQILAHLSFSWEGISDRSDKRMCREIFFYLFSWCFPFNFKLKKWNHQFLVSHKFWVVKTNYPRP